jgi:hypothetical protein
MTAEVSWYTWKQKWGPRVWRILGMTVGTEQHGRPDHEIAEGLE